MRWWFFTKQEPTKSLYEKRIECFQKMIENQKQTMATNNEYITVTLMEGKEHENAHNRLEIYQKEYRNLYNQCKDVIIQ